jgi:hypothetical protein
MLMWDARDLPYTLESAQDDWCFRLPDGRLGCSARQPGRDSIRRCQEVPEKSRPLLLGLGAGHDLESLLARDPLEITVVEADPRSLATALERWTRLGRLPLEDRRVRLLAAHKDADLLPLLAEELAAEHGERPVLVHPLCPELWRSCCPEAARLVDELLLRRRQAARQERLLHENEVLNHARLSAALGVDSLWGSWGQAPVLVCGAGPGLVQAMASRVPDADLRLVAVSTVLPVLMGLGLHPHVVVATDPSPLLAADLDEDWELREVPLLVFPGTSASLVARWPGPLVLALPEGPGLHGDTWGNLRPGRLTSGCGTVAAPALDFASRLSSGDLYLAGVDLEAGTRPYASGVRRPLDQPLPDFAYPRRRMAELVQRLEKAGRCVMSWGPRPDWMPSREDRHASL